MKAVVQQAVHGYARGHVELAASIKLDRGDADLLTRLSDLSGTLSQERGFISYLTFYPLPSQSYYAVAKTWLDEEAPRAGCVLTHTLLVPMDLWTASEHPHSFAPLLRRPSRNTLESFRTPVSVVSLHESLPEACDRTITEFASRYFGEGLQPLVWFGANATELIAWRLIQALWPSLRRQFSCCTYALKPRALDERPFDVLFAPEEALSRFSEYAREHIVQPSTGVAPAQETWLTRWVSCVFSNPNSERDRDFIARVKALSQSIEPYPTAIRRVFLFLELSDRVNEVSMAAVGALDVLGTLGLPQALLATGTARLVRATLDSASKLSAEERIELLYLLGERVAVLHDRGIESEIRSAVADLLVSAESEILRKAEDLVGRHSGRAPDAFLLGVTDAILRRLESRSSDVSLVLKLSTLGPLLVARFPESAYVLVMAGRKLDVSETTDTLIDWCSRVQNGVSREALRERLLPFLIPKELPLARELLRDVGPTELVRLCAAIERGPSAAASETAWVYAEALSGLQISEIQAWAQSNEVDSYFSAFLLALGLPLNDASVDQVVSQMGGRKKSVLAVAFVERAISHGQSMWLERRLDRDQALWSLMLTDPGDAYVGSALERVCGRIRRSAIARMPGVPSRLSETPPAIQDHALSQWVMDWINVEGETSTLGAWLTESWVVTRLQRNPSIPRQRITEQEDWPTTAWLRAWTLVEILPLSEESVSGVVDIVDHLVRNRPERWDDQASVSWCRLIDRLNNHASVHLELCTRAFQFCIDHPRLQVAPVAAATFFPVHNAALQERPSTSFNIFGFLQWDRGLELRRRLVDAFCQGHWPPEWFAIAAHEPWLLRKMCKRMTRQWRGEEFLQRAYEALGSIDAPEHSALLEALREIVRSPRYDEDWD